MAKNRKFNDFVNTRHLRADSVTSVEMGDNELHTLCFMWERDAGVNDTIASHALPDKDGNAQTIPDNAVMVGTWFEGNTTITSGGSAQIALGVTGAATALKAATVISDGGFAATALTALSINKTASAVSVLLTPSVAALTGGKFFIWIQYYEGA